MNQEELEHFYDFYSTPVNDLFKELQEITRSNNLSLFHSRNKYSSDLFVWLSHHIFFHGEDNETTNEDTLLIDER